MFSIYFRDSLKALPWLILVPIAVYILYIMAIDPNYVQAYTIATKDSGGSWYERGPNFMLTSMIVAIVVNVICVMIIPSAIGGADSRSKKVEFYVGFFVNLFCALLVPIICFSMFGLDGATTGILTGLHIAAFLVPFIGGSFFVAGAYVSSFWFVQR